MQDFSKHRKRTLLGRAIINFVGTLVLIGIAFVVVRAAYNMYGKFSQAAQGATEAKMELSELQAQKAQVGAAVDSFSTRRGLEAEVRERYGVAKPGEGRIEIVRDSPTTSPQSAGSQNVFTWLIDFLWPF